jgi:hypothetical protein
LKYSAGGVENFEVLIRKIEQVDILVFGITGNVRNDRCGNFVETLIELASDDTLENHIQTRIRHSEKHTGRDTKQNKHAPSDGSFADHSADLRQ